ncbi:MAG: flagellar export chaperone FliS [Pseudomonadales bacterium]|nr:flagellar export chaperone FliS [Pseudomonadales bacterium]
MNTNKALSQYNAVNKQTGVEDKNPHELIMMLYDGAIDNMVRAKGCIQRKDFAGKGETLGRAITIIGGLQGFLDMDKGGEVSQNLDALYDYCSQKLFEATKDNDEKVIDEIVGLIKEVREGWVGIKDEAAEIFANQKPAL